jgi:hypothetical protein
MASRAKSKRTKTAGRLEYKGEHPLDVISANVQKVHGIVAALRGACENDSADISPCDLRNLCWALSGLLWDAWQAMDVITADSLAQRDSEAGSVS